MPDLEDHGAELSATPPDCTKLFRIIILLVNQVCLIENFLRLHQTDAMLAFDPPAFCRIEVQAHLYNCYTILVSAVPSPFSPELTP